MKFIAIAASVAFLNGCVAPSGAAGGTWKNVHPDWNPPQGLEYAQAQCDAKAEGVSGYDWIDASSNKYETKKACMKAFGYE